MEDRLKLQIAFLVETDKMKSVLRQSLVMDGSRRENDAEHSWQLALMAMVFYEYADQEHVDISKVIKMALVHDLVEIYAGDTFAYDGEGYESKRQRELEAADRLFAMLPEGQGQELRALWEEFEAMETPSSLYTNAVDRFQPMLCNYMTEGHAWKLHNVAVSSVYKRMEPMKTAAPALWKLMDRIMGECVEKGWLRDA